MEKIFNSKIFQNIGYLSIGFVLGTAFTLNFAPALAQKTEETPIEYKQEYKNERIEKLMATSTLDLIEATKIDFQDANTKAITQRLDTIIRILNAKNSN